MRRYAGRIGSITTLLCFTAAAPAQPPATHITPNWKDADFTELVQAVSVTTGHSFVIDRQVRARVTMLASSAMSPAAFYDSFLALLPICGFVAVSDGNMVKIMPSTKAPMSRLIRVGLTDFSSVSCVGE
jgi:general secretion pathway protein D